MPDKNLICSVSSYSKKRTFYAGLVLALFIGFLLYRVSSNLILSFFCSILMYILTSLSAKLAQRTVNVFPDYIEIDYPHWSFARAQILTTNLQEVRFTRHSSNGITLFWISGGKKHRSNLTPLMAFAKALKFWYQNGIPIKNLDKDHELELYITGQIEEYPMKNEG